MIPLYKLCWNTTRLDKLNKAYIDNRLMELKPGSNIGQTISDKIRKVKKSSAKKNKAIVLIIKQKETKCNNKKRYLKGLYYKLHEFKNSINNLAIQIPYNSKKRKSLIHSLRVY